MVTEEAFQKAAGLFGGSTGGSISGHSGAISIDRDDGKNHETPANQGFRWLVIVPANVRSGRTKIRTSADTPGENDIVDSAVSSAVSFDADLRELIDAWPRLSEKQRADIRWIVNGV